MYINIDGAVDECILQGRLFVGGLRSPDKINSTFLPLICIWTLVSWLPFSLDEAPASYGSR